MQNNSTRHLGKVTKPSKIVFPAIYILPIRTLISSFEVTFKSNMVLRRGNSTYQYCQNVQNIFTNLKTLLLHYYIFDNNFSYITLLHKYLSILSFEHWLLSPCYSPELVQLIISLLLSPIVSLYGSLPLL